MQKFLHLATLIGLLLILSSCSWLSRKVPIEQGNVFNQSMIDQLKPGMSMEQVEQIMGTPVLSNDFDPNRLDYIYSYRQGKKYKYERVILVFDKDKLMQITGTLVPESDYQ